MKIPDNRDIFEGKLATFWFDEDGILCAVGKNIHRTLEMQQENYAFIKQITDNKKFVSSRTHQMEVRRTKKQESIL